jgi:hypothetical protein
VTTTSVAGPSPADSEANRSTDPGKTPSPTASIEKTGVWRLIFLAWRDAPRVVWLARAGILFALLQSWIYLSWMFSADFTPRATGTDPLPGYVLWSIRGWEVFGVLGAVVFVGWMIRDFRRHGKLHAVGITVFAVMLTAWQDPFVDYLVPMFSYNSHFLNMGTWAHHIPGWETPFGANPQPIAFWIATYLLFTPVTCLACVWLLNKIRRRFPAINRFGLLLILAVSLVVADIVIEGVWLQQGLYAYMRVDPWFHLDPGTLGSGALAAFPLQEALLFGGLYMLVDAAIYYFRDDKGLMWTDKGVDTLQVGRSPAVVRILAMSAVMNVVFLIFNVAFTWFNLQASQTPDQPVPSYFTNGLCGVGDNPRCPPLVSGK